MSQNLRPLFFLSATILFAVMTFAMLVVGLVFSGYALAGLIFAILFGIVASYLGLLTLRSYRQASKGSVGTGLGQEHSRLLKLAAHQNGRLTAEEAAIECRVSVQQAEQMLDQLVNQGRADTWVSDSGAMVYVFQGLLEDEKSTAEDPMKMLEP